ncbi:hypothetical protein LTR53_014141 [Teratosphaeriaceae sp. CCFEE 6253]|nr:hypothetical protein LTR53_014141 [Teratosphaeriaceae sp. CCFEE 6253]
MPAVSADRKPHHWREEPSDLVLPTLLGAFLPLILTFGAVISVSSISGRGDTSGCDPNNQVFLFNAPSQWRTDYFLSVTLGFGNLDFTTAKLIDVLWDLLFSRCGQALAAWITYKAFSQSLLLSMEGQPVTYAEYTAVAFQPTTRRVWTSIAFVFATLYVLALPTIASAMTSYQAKSVAMMPITANVTVPVAGLIHYVRSGLSVKTALWYEGPAGNRNFTEAEVVQGGVCQPLQTYRWGFSFLLVLAFLILTYVFALVTFALWQDAKFNRRSDSQDTRRLGTISAALEIAEAVHAAVGHGAQGLENDELEAMLKGAGMARLSETIGHRGRINTGPKLREQSQFTAGEEGVELRTLGKNAHVEEVALLGVDRYA